VTGAQFEADACDQFSRGSADMAMRARHLQHIADRERLSVHPPAITNLADTRAVIDELITDLADARAVIDGLLDRVPPMPADMPEVVAKGGTRIRLAAPKHRPILGPKSI
jgi:hypothetical protein